MPLHYSFGAQFTPSTLGLTLTIALLRRYHNIPPEKKPKRKTKAGEEISVREKFSPLMTSKDVPMFICIVRANE